MTYKQLLFCFVFFIFCHIVKSENGPLGARASALGKVSVLHKDLWSVENNPAAMGFVKSFGGGISYKSPFLLNEFATKAAVISYPTENGAFGLHLKQFGYALFNENKLGLSYGQQLGKNIALGIQLSYLKTQINEGNYTNKSAVSGSVGIFAKPSDEFTLAAVIINPNRAKYSDYQDERYPTYLKMGVGYHFSDKVILMAEVEKDIDHMAQAKFGVEYKAIDILHFRAGYASNPSISSFGFGLKLNDFKLDFSSSFHNTLGFSPQVSLSFEIDRKK